MIVLLVFLVLLIAIAVVLGRSVARAFLSLVVGVGGYLLVVLAFFALFGNWLFIPFGVAAVVLLYALFTTSIQHRHEPRPKILG